jgi:hypothetical protein
MFRGSACRGSLSAFGQPTFGAALSVLVLAGSAEIRCEDCPRCVIIG